MPVCLQKGQKVSLTKGNPGLTKVVVGVGWDINQYDTGASFDFGFLGISVEGRWKGKRFRGFCILWKSEAPLPAQWSTWEIT